MTTIKKSFIQDKQQSNIHSHHVDQMLFDEDLLFPFCHSHGIIWPWLFLTTQISPWKLGGHDIVQKNRFATFLFFLASFIISKQLPNQVRYVRGVEDFWATLVSGKWFYKCFKHTKNQPNNPKHPKLLAKGEEGEDTATITTRLISKTNTVLVYNKNEGVISCCVFVELVYKKSQVLPPPSSLSLPHPGNHWPRRKIDSTAGGWYSEGFQRRAPARFRQQMEVYDNPSWGWTGKQPDFQIST